MDYTKYLGFKINEICPILNTNSINYEIREIWDTKNTKIGNDLRVVKVIEGNPVILIAAYF